MGQYGALAAALVTLLIAALCLLVQLRLQEKRPHLAYWAAAHVALSINFLLFGYADWRGNLLYAFLVVLMQQGFGVLLAFGIRHHLNLPSNLTAALALTGAITLAVTGLMTIYPAAYFAAPGIALLLVQLYGGALLLTHRRSVLYIGLGLLLILRSLNTLIYVAVAQQQGGPPTAEWPFIISLLVNLATGIGLVLLEFDDAHRAMTQSARAKDDALALVQAVIDTVQAVVHYKDRDLQYQLINRRSRQVLGYGDAPIIGKKLSEIAPPDLALPIERGDRAVLFNKDVVIDQEWHWRDADSGKQKIYWLSKSVVRDSAGEPMGVVTAAIDITALKETERRLIQEREVAERANKAKSQFLANMSHELRTPLNAVIGFADIMHQGLFGPLGNARYDEYVSSIQQSGQHLLSLINDILDMSRIEAGRVELNEDRIDVGMVLEDCLDLVAVQARAKNVRVDFPRGQSDGALWADERAMRQMVLNLLSNAVKFTAEGGSVTVQHGTAADGWYEISITDTGIGMAENEVARVFEPFARGGSQLVRQQYDGTGLGLPITRRLVELHGGRIQLKSQSGVGTTAMLRFPPERISRVADFGAILSTPGND